MPAKSAFIRQDAHGSIRVSLDGEADLPNWGVQAIRELADHFGISLVALAVDDYREKCAELSALKGQFANEQAARREACKERDEARNLANDYLHRREEMELELASTRRTLDAVTEPLEVDRARRELALIKTECDGLRRELRASQDDCSTAHASHWEDHQALATRTAELGMAREAVNKQAKMLEAARADAEQATMYSHGDSETIERLRRELVEARRQLIEAKDAGGSAQKGMLLMHARRAKYVALDNAVGAYLTHPPSADVVDAYLQVEKAWRAIRQTKCQRCNGSGRLPPWSPVTSPCDDCGGTGEAPAVPRQ